MTNKEIVLQKWGGSSIAEKSKMGLVAKHITKTAEKKGVVAVVSAMGNETDRLIQLAQEVSGGPAPRDELDKLVITGELQSAPLLTMAIRRLGKAATSLTGWEIGLEVDSTGKVKRVRNVGVIENLLDQGQIVVVAGFQGIIEGTNQVVTLGRGGSDTTAVVVTAALGLDCCEMYTDVDGVYAIDPKIIPRAKRFKSVQYGQMIQLSEAGVGKPMDRSVVLAQNLGVKIKVLISPSLGESSGGTLICSGSSLEEMESSFAQPGIAIQRVRQIKISDVPNEPGVAAIIFKALSGINLVDSVQVPGTEKTDISLLCLTEDSSLIIAKLERIKETGIVGQIKISKPTAVVELTLVHPLMKEEPNYLWKIFEAIGREKVNIEMYSSAGTTISAVVNEENLKKAAQALAEEFELLE